MQSSQLPNKFQIPWANAAGGSFIRAVPQASQIGVVDGAASLTDGFPPLNFLPVGTGGVPPFGQDMNGILNQITLWQRWQAAGGNVSWDSAFSSAVGGYPIGAVLTSATAGVLWLNTVENNATNPDSTSASGWLAILTTAYLLAKKIIGRRIVEFAAAGSISWTPPSDCTLIEFELVGGGGGGGGALNAACAASAGAGGGYSHGIQTVTPSVAIAGTVGAAGTVGLAGGGNGGNGGATALGGFATANGGTSGKGASSGIDFSVNPGGAAAGGSLENRTGFSGGIGYQVGASLYTGGIGGNAPLTGAVSPLTVNASGGAALSYGGGGGGASANAAGGTAGGGYIRIFY